MTKKTEFLQTFSKLKQEKKKEEVKKPVPKIKKPVLPKPIVKVEEKVQV